MAPCGLAPVAAALNVGLGWATALLGPFNIIGSVAMGWPWAGGA
jgi:hypothetical protein